MPSEKSGRVAERKRIRNRSVRNSTRTMVAKAVGVIRQSQVEEAEVAVLQAIKALDTANKKGVIHDNNAARRKSRLMAKFNALKPQS